MKKNIHIAVIFTAFLIFGSSVYGQGMMGGYRIQNINTEQTIAEETQGGRIWEKFQAKEITCANLSDDDFHLIGEYFMGQMMGSSHVFMNEMMTQQLGEQGEAQMHVVMGKRLSGCDSSAAYPGGGIGYMPMMQMMWGGLPYSGFGYNDMMNFGYGFGLIPMLASVVWLAVGILAATWLWKKIQGK